MSDIPEQAILEHIRAEMLRVGHDVEETGDWNIIASALMAAEARSKAEMREMLQNPAAVLVNSLRGEINADSIRADERAIERERCAKIADDEMSACRALFDKGEDYGFKRRMAGRFLTASFIASNIRAS